MSRYFWLTSVHIPSSFCRKMVNISVSSLAFPNLNVWMFHICSTIRGQEHFWSFVGRLQVYYMWDSLILFFLWTQITFTLLPQTLRAGRDHCFPLAVAVIRRDSSCSFGTNNYLTSCHNQIPLIKGTIQRLPGVIKLARVFLDFQLSPVGGALYPGRWFQLWLGALCCTGADSSSLTITMSPG